MPRRAIPILLLVLSGVCSLLVAIATNVVTDSMPHQLKRYFSWPLLLVYAAVGIGLSLWLFLQDKTEERQSVSTEPHLYFRRQMLRRVERQWIREVLEASLQPGSLIPLGMEYHPELTSSPRGKVVRQKRVQERSIPAGTPIVSVFESLDGEMLLLGQPGAGKTTALLELTRALLAEANRDAVHPIPVVFNLSSWAERRQPLVEWVVEQMRLQYSVSPSISRPWLEQDRLLLLLDGLDEVDSAHRDDCVKAINDFRREHGLVPMVISSRTADYEVLTERLLLRGAVELKPLTAEQMDAYLTQAGAQFLPLRELIQEHPPLRELASNPLMLGLMALVHRDVAPSPQASPLSLEEWRTRLFQAYTDAMFERRSGVRSRYSRQRTLQWLSWMARLMKQNNQWPFFLEEVQPDWLWPRRFSTYSVTVGLVATSPLWVLYLVLFLEEGPWTFVRDYALSLVLITVLVARRGAASIRTVPILRWSWKKALRWMFLGVAIIPAMFLLDWLVRGLFWSLVRGLLVGLGVGAGLWLLARFLGGWLLGSRRAAGLARKVSMAGLGIAGLVATLFFWGRGRLEVGARQEFVESLATVGLLTGIVGVLALFFGGLTRQAIDEVSVPNEGIRRSARNSVAIAVITVVFFGLLFLIGAGEGPLPARLMSMPASGMAFMREPLRDKLAVALVLAYIGWGVGLVFGGFACIQHAVLRCFLALRGYAPMSYVRFLDYASGLVLLRRTGGGYIFIHRLLMEHFASRSIDEQHTEAR
ncbi:NACHT domain-containing protein [Archangium lansingense]|uniref:NACHT domain-containing protein n=1 Tax=Archangium lansingense TaxID=2995310 RepID=UPI003B761BEE